MKIFHITFHLGCAADIQKTMQFLGHFVDTVYLPHEPGYSVEWYTMTDAVTSLLAEKYRPRMTTADVLMSSDTAPLARLFMTETDKPVIVWVCNRFDYNVPDANLKSYYKECCEFSRCRWVKYIAYTRYEITYAQRKQVNIQWHSLINPVGTIMLVLPPQQTQPMSKTLFIGQYHNDAIAFNLRELVRPWVESAGYSIGAATRYDNNLHDYAAVIHIPYAASNLALFEAITQGIVYIIPTPEFYRQLFNHKIVGVDYRDNMWLQLPSEDLETSDWYSPQNKEWFLFFNSWQELPGVLTAIDHHRNKLVQQAGKRHITVMLQRWQQALAATTVKSIDSFKPFLDNAMRYYTPDEKFMRYFGRVPQSRFYTFQKCLQLLADKHNPVVVELGTTRSFVDGRFVGCNDSDPKYWDPFVPECWDWSAGCFTHVFASCLQNPIMHTIDLAAEHIARSKIMNATLFPFLQFHVCSSEDFLKNFAGTIDLLYLDTGDMTPIAHTAQLQLAEAHIIVERSLVSIGGIILIDDVRSCVPFEAGETVDRGKAYLSIPYLLEHGFTVLMDEYQSVLQRYC